MDRRGTFMMRNTVFAGLAALLLITACADAAEEAVKIPAPALDEPAASGNLQTAVVAGGCFWGVQGVYQHLKGVKSVVSGYAGGERATADYESVSSGNSRHAEAVQIVYDPAVVTYGQILQVFFSVVHDPTQLNRQGPDRGTQYRSAIFYGDATQKKIADTYIAQLDKASVYPRRIVTRVDPLQRFYEAESYHQDYLINHPTNPYIVVNDLPKVRSFQSMFPALYAAVPVTVSAARRGGVRATPTAPKAAPVGSGAMMMAAAEPAAKPVDSGAMMSAHGASGPSKTQGPLPPLDGATGWLNSKPLTREALRGKVVVVDFWAYSCINCLRSMPYVNAWYRHYKDSGLVVLGVHSPEFAFEKELENVRAAVARFDIRYPIALDSNLAIWKAFNNRFWPAHYFVDAKGQIRGHHFGEGKYASSERQIRRLLTEAGAKNLPEPLDDAAGTGVAAPADIAAVASPETYLGFARAENFASPSAMAPDATKDYTIPKALVLNQWALGGSWKVASEHARLDRAPGRIAFRFKARDLHLVLGPATAGNSVRFRVTVNGAPPKTDAGMDVDADGNGVVREHRLYQLIREKGPVTEQVFVIEFLDPGVDAYSFTFG
jgi:methionine-S-sulfoxide reductase